MRRGNALFCATICLVSFGFVVNLAMAAGPPLDRWKPTFDPTTAKYKLIVSNASHPAFKGVYTGFAIRDALWERSNGQIYLDYKPFSILGREEEAVLKQVQTGAIQGMGMSSLAATDLGPRFGVVNLPFLVNSFDKLDKFTQSGKLFDHFMMAMDHEGIMGLDITGYGNYGWATTRPVKRIRDAKKVKIRIAEADLSKLLYRNWGFNPVIMPWPDVTVSLRQGIITGLDHTPAVCSITRKLAVCKYYTQLDYAQGLYIWIFNKAWYNQLPADLQKTFTAVVHDVCAKIRAETKQQEIDEIAKAKASGIQFFRLPDADMAALKRKGDAAHVKYAREINKAYSGDKHQFADYLKEVQDYMGY